MLCIWSSKASVTTLPITFTQNAARIPLALKNCPSGIWRFGSKPYLDPTSMHHTSRPAPRMMGPPALSRPCSHPPAVVSHSASSITPAPFVLDHLTSAQLSRASAAAVRISVARGDIWDGFHLWHSLRWSMHHYHNDPNSQLPSFVSPTTAFVAIDFGRQVPTRLAGHCLLHGLLRAGKTKAAAMLTEQMMAFGDELNPLSFKILLRQLRPSASPHSPRAIYDGLRGLTPRRKMPRGPRILELQSVIPTDPFTRIAVRLLNKARKHRWQRTTGMYENVLRACLMQGEIIVASLLLALLLKDYQLRQACSRVAAEAERVGLQDTMTYVHSKIQGVPSRGYKRLPYHSSYLLFQSVAQSLERHCAHVDDPLFPEASQALAIVASALDARRIPYTSLATLIKVLYSYPQCQHTVWVTLPSGERQTRDAYRYFHGILLNLLCSFPDRRSLDPNVGQPPALNLESYNALLNYAVRYRHSLTLADRVLYHMTELRKPALAPSIATYNILLRGSTLMRRNDIAESILRTMQWRLLGHQHNFPPFTLQGRNSQIKSSQIDLPSERHRYRFRRLLEETRKHALSIPKPQGLPEPDNILLTSYMAHLVATGHPNTVAALITRIIPEFELPEKPTTSEALIARWQTGVVRGVALGPHFFAVALNALRKAGLRRLAEHVWTLARAAETRSLESGSTTPWCLSVHAYTAMLQLYADETRGWDLDHPAACVDRPTYPRRLRNPRRAESGLRKGMQIFRALSLAGDKVHEAAVRAREEGRVWKQVPVPPKADARFYNAALSLVYRRPGMHPWGSRESGSRRWWYHVLGKANQHFLLTGQKPHGWTPELEEIAKSIRSSGYALPIGFELRFVGREGQVISQHKKRSDIGARPYSFGRKVRTRFAPHRIPTVKRKGLPLCGRWRRSRWSDTESVDYPVGQIVG
ncbi:hypothetical protein F5148DRAFT_376776 [Russula earlei]|uniref:Uncharacterized protein n=1 Tax=Russula earlei TaxID=71964 RepID=A0ACC0UIY4_9AGAM|nr:hypothetical protein F5148DRAFT_376776 [Russula earlei]